MNLTRIKALGLAAALPLAAIAAPVAAHDHGAKKTVSTATYAPITEAEVIAAQQAWGNALVAIATEYDNKGHAAAKKLAGEIIDSAYGYNLGPVLFKPTLANGEGEQTFRTSRDGAVSYFVGGDPKFAQDSGFALKGWRSFEIDNAGILITGNSATSMGHVTVIDAKGNRTTVDKTWGYVRGPDGKLRIVVHHSSLPYSAG
ncbi:phosphoribosyl-AMP cyclohydrolase [Qipengyuania sp. 6B39]|uniref:phosphoribosyl-AMP cyclohydrolase n=1 Tax=Qipengyuania proteolytica TaxID=2867239 RepID=UPI001C8A62ED|nr:phosphoribosyl-AMP cyclohydrolase [Qipengyuania proteolytica]MBX7495888.1 phosphoribosyl-AMP cyclohydrolase [Qipengyuania proteolytica]